MPRHHADTLTSAEAIIDLAALGRNYDRIRRHVAPVGSARSAEIAGMVKSDGYGLGAVTIAQELHRNGCRKLFVAVLDEAIELRHSLTEADGSEPVEIFVLSGPMPSTEGDYVAHDVTPILNSTEQVERWASTAQDTGRRLPAGLHLDTGMNRLGVSEPEWATLGERRHDLAGIDWRIVMSHLASADDPDSTQSSEQLSTFRRASEGVFADAPWDRAARSLANSAGVFAGPDYHFDLVRPGIALYGGSPRPGAVMEPVVTVRAPVIQVSELAAGDTVGYAATYQAPSGRRIATVAAGYGDGFPRSGSGSGSLVLVDHGRDGAEAICYDLPILGRVSMDLVTVDVSAVPLDQLWPGRAVEILGPHRLLDDAADAAGTIGYELLCNLGGRYRRRFVPGV